MIRAGRSCHRNPTVSPKPEKTLPFRTEKKRKRSSTSFGSVTRTKRLCTSPTQDQRAKEPSKSIRKRSVSSDKTPTKKCEEELKRIKAKFEHFIKLKRSRSKKTRDEITKLNDQLKRSDSRFHTFKNKYERVLSKNAELEEQIVNYKKIIKDKEATINHWKSIELKTRSDNCELLMLLTAETRQKLETKAKQQKNYNTRLHASIFSASAMEGSSGIQE